MAMNDLPVGSGLPAWAWSTYDAVAITAIAAMLASVIAGVAARFSPPRGYGLHAGISAASALVALVWTFAAALGSAAPRGGSFCNAPADWVVEIAPTCTARWPIWLLASPVAFAVALAGAGLALALWRSRTRVAAVLGAGAVAVLVATGLQPALLQPDVFEAGGLTSAPDAFARLTLDPIRGSLGVALGVGIVILGRLRARRVTCRWTAKPRQRT
jgi:hypothetical protein